MSECLTLILERPRSARLVANKLPSIGPNDVCVRSVYSTFKHGTEMAAYFGHIPLASKRFNQELRLFEAVSVGEAVGYYPRTLGNMVVGDVEKVGTAVETLEPGQRVYAWAPISDRHVAAANKFIPLDGLTPEQALVVDPAAFALGATLDGSVTSTDTVLVTGLGAIGLLAIQYCRAKGARVIAASSFAARRHLAATYGATHVYDSNAIEDLGLAVKRDFGGADVALECAGSTRALHQSIRSTRQCGRVVCVGVYGPAEASLNLGEEFLHNRITLLASLPAYSWNNPTRSESPLHWTELRDTVARDLINGLIAPDGLLYPTLPFSQAEEAVKLIASSPENVVKVLLSHDQ